MFKNDRMMTIFTGLILAVFAGSMVQYGDRFMALLSGESQVQTSDDFYSVRAGGSQILDVLANDEIKGAIVVINQPSCGVVSLSGTDQLRYSSDSSCTGEIVFTYCVDSGGACASNAVTMNVISLAQTQVAEAQQSSSEMVLDAPDVEIAEADAVQEDEDEPSAPVDVASISPSPSTDQAPSLNNIVISMQPPTLVAPSIDEFVTPGVATASIRQQNVVLENTAANTDTGIDTQSSTETVAPVEFGASNFGAPLGAEDSNVLMGSAPADQQIAIIDSPQLENIATNPTPVNTQLERGPVALAELSGVENTTFGTFSPEAETGSQLMELASVDTFSSPENDLSTAINQAETGQTNLDIERSNTTALIALQLSGAPLAQDEQNQLDLQLPEIGIGETITLQQPAPIELANATQTENVPNVLGRGPEIFGLANALPDTNALLQNSQATVDILLANPFSATQTASVDLLELPLARDEKLNGQISAELDALQVQANDLHFNPSNIDENVTLVMANLGDPDIFAPKNIEPDLGAAFDVSGILPQVNKNVPGDLSVVPFQFDQNTELASLETSNIDQPKSDRAISQLTDCEIFLDPSVRTGANILLFLSAECKPNMPVTIAHAGLEFTILTDADGSANVVIPALQRTAEITATFKDGSAETTVALVTQIGEVTRAAVTWRGEADLDLNAYEYGALPGSDGHVWAGSARDFRSARLRGGGYLVQLGDPTIAGGALAEVYTMPLGRTVERGSVTMTLEVKNAGTVCGDSISARTLRTRADNNASSRSIRFTVPNCANGTLTKLSVPGAVDDIRLAAK